MTIPLLTINKALVPLHVVPIAIIATAIVKNLGSLTNESKTQNIRKKLKSFSGHNAISQPRKNCDFLRAPKKLFYTLNSIQY